MLKSKGSKTAKGRYGLFFGLFGGFWVAFTCIFCDRGTFGDAFVYSRSFASFDAGFACFWLVLVGFVTGLHSLT